MRLTIHQPEYLPWAGYFHKLAWADTFVLLDHVPFSKNYFQNRNKIRTAQGFTWLTVPVGHASETPIREIKIDNRTNPRWRERHWRGLSQAYSHAAYFGDHEAFFRDLYQKPWDHLANLNETVIRYLIAALGIEVTLIRGSELNTGAAKAALILEICERLGARVYLSGVSGRDYLDPARFAAQGIELVFQEFHHPVYSQCYQPFLPCMSVVDLLFNHGPRALEMIHGTGTETLAHVFE